MLSINPWNILWTVVNLLVIYAIFKKFLFQPVMNVINAREKMINDQLQRTRLLNLKKNITTRLRQQRRRLTRY